MIEGLGYAASLAYSPRGAAEAFNRVAALIHAKQPERTPEPDFDLKEISSIIVVM